jgi:hypothetical protein
LEKSDFDFEEEAQALKSRVVVKLVKVNYGRIWKRTSEAMR